jgi:hypothetical protein
LRRPRFSIYEVVAPDDDDDDDDEEEEEEEEAMTLVSLILGLEITGDNTAW